MVSLIWIALRFYSFSINTIQIQYLISSNRKLFVIKKEKLYHILESITPKEVTEYPFPQADRVDRLFDLLHWMGDREVTYLEIENHYRFKDIHSGDRQGKYYGNAASYLNFTKSVTEDSIVITNNGKELIQASPNDQIFLLAKAMAYHLIFYEVIRLSLQCGYVITKDEILSITQKYNKECIECNDYTMKRRSQTIYKWVTYIFDEISTLF